MARKAERRAEPRRPGSNIQTRRIEGGGKIVTHVAKKAERKKQEGPAVPPPMTIPRPAERRAEPRRPGSNIQTRRIEGGGKIVTHGPGHKPPPPDTKTGARSLKEMSKGARSTPKPIARPLVPEPRKAGESIRRAITRNPVQRATSVVKSAASSALKRFQVPIPIPSLMEDVIGKRTGRRTKRA